MREFMSELVWTWTAMACMYLGVKVLQSSVPWYILLPCWLICFWGAAISCRMAFPAGLFGIRP